MDIKEKFMKKALAQAKKAYDKLEVPVGAVIVKDGKIIASAYNQKETKYDTTKHAEILAIQKASKKLKSWRLIDCEMYVTLEPCPMCAGAIVNARIKEVVFGAYDLSMGCIDSVTSITSLPFAAGTTVFGGVKEDECKKILTDFFEGVR
mgnify:CR=1 FL=1